MSKSISEYTLEPAFNPLPREFYTRNDVVQIAKELLGKVLYTYIGNEVTAGVICETEAYAGISDKASHAFNNRRTARTEVMYKSGGHAYVYLCYGIHSLFNIVTSREQDPHAVLIRGIVPYKGVEVMKTRVGKPLMASNFRIGPGSVSKLLGIRTIHTGVNLCPKRKSEKEIWVQDEGLTVKEGEFSIHKRIGIEYSGEDALLPYRFCWDKAEIASF